MVQGAPEELDSDSEDLDPDHVATQEEDKAIREPRKGCKKQVTRGERLAAALSMPEDLVSPRPVGNRSKVKGTRGTEWQQTAT